MADSVIGVCPVADGMGLIFKNTFFHLPPVEDVNVLQDGPATCPPAIEGWWASASTPKGAAPEPVTPRASGGEQNFGERALATPQSAVFDPLAHDIGPTPTVWDLPRGASPSDVGAKVSTPQPGVGSIPAIGQTPDWFNTPSRGLSSPGAAAGRALSAVGDVPKISASGGLSGFNKLLMDAINMEEDSDEEDEDAELQGAPSVGCALATPLETPLPHQFALPPQALVAQQPQKAPMMPMMTAPPLATTAPVAAVPPLATAPMAPGLRPTAPLPLPRQPALPSTLPAPRQFGAVLGTQPPQQGSNAYFAAPALVSGEPAVLPTMCPPPLLQVPGAVPAGSAHSPVRSAGAGGQHPHFHLPPELLQQQLQQQFQPPQLQQHPFFLQPNPVVVDLVRQFGVLSPGLSSSQKSTESGAGALATSDKDKKARRRRGCKEAKDPDRGLDDVWWLPTLAVVDLGQLQKVSSVTPFGKGNDSEARWSPKRGETKKDEEYTVSAPMCAAPACSAIPASDQ